MQGLASNTLAQVIGGLILAALSFLFGVWYSTTPAIEATVNWVDVPNPVRALSGSTESEVPKVILDAIGAPLTAEVRHALRFQDRLRVAEVNIKNSSEYRSKKVDLIAPESTLLFITTDGGKTVSTSQTTTMGNLNPNSEVKIIALTRALFRENSIAVLHDDKKIDVQQINSNSYNPLRSIVEKYPFASFMFAIIGGLLVMTTLAMIGLAYYGSKNLDWRARTTSVSDLKSLIALLEYMQDKYPEKYSAAKSQQSK